MTSRPGLPELAIDFRDERRVVGEARPGPVGQYLWVADLQIPCINTIEPKQRQGRRIRSRGFAPCIRKSFHQPRTLGQDAVCAVAPIVEIAGDDYPRVVRDVAIDDAGEPGELLGAVLLCQSKMHADGVQAFSPAWRFELRVQQAPVFRADLRNVPITIVKNRELAEQRIPMVAAGIHRVLAIGIIVPDRVGEEFVLCDIGPVFVPGGVNLVFAQYFLEEDNVRRNAADGIAQLVEHEAPAEMRKAFVQVERQDLQH